MKTAILGLIELEGYEKENDTTNHIQKRKSRTDLVIKDAKKLFQFLVYRADEDCLQIHCLYEDASLYVYNKEDKKIVTVMLLTEEELDNYLIRTSEKAIDYPFTYKCAKLHREVFRRGEEEVYNRKMNLFEMERLR